MQMVISFLFQEHSVAATDPPCGAARLSWRYRRESHSAPGKNGSAGRPVLHGEAGGARPGRRRPRDTLRGCTVLPVPGSQTSPSSFYCISEVSPTVFAGFQVILSE